MFMMQSYKKNCAHLTKIKQKLKKDISEFQNYVLTQQNTSSSLFVYL